MNDEDVFDDIAAELVCARKKFPKNEHKLAALMEEVGELAQAMLHHHYKGAPASDVYAEAIQVAVMAIRVATEGDHSFAYQPNPVLVDEPPTE